jgi:hypothetical protein
MCDLTEMPEGRVSTHTFAGVHPQRLDGAALWSSVLCISEHAVQAKLKKIASNPQLVAADPKPISQVRHSWLLLFVSPG